RRYLFDCPKNSIRNYDPPKINKVNLPNKDKQHDTTLHNIQYRLSGLTRPIDWFAYRLLHYKWDQETQTQQTLDFVEAMHELLSDMASHITSLRTDNMFKAYPNVSAPSNDQQNYLMDPKELADHIKNQQSIYQNTIRKTNNNRPRPRR
ncbi:hypothetical protein BJ944DRAFT_149490, partial [Cunninghamella echinulata]